MNPRSPLARGREGWQYISLPRGPTGSAGHLENRIPARTCGGLYEVRAGDRGRRETVIYFVFEERRASERNDQSSDRRVY